MSSRSPCACRLLATLTCVLLVSLLLSHHSFAPLDMALALLPLLKAARPFAIWSTTIQVGAANNLAML